MRVRYAASTTSRVQGAVYKNASPTLLKRLIKNIDVRGLFDCWPWTGKIERNGYGRIRVGGRGSVNAPSHRVAYWLLVENGEAYDENDERYALEVDHTCENKRCHNPAHLQLSTRHKNLWYRYHDRTEEYRPPYADTLSEEELDEMDRYLEDIGA